MSIKVKNALVQGRTAALAALLGVLAACSPRLPSVPPPPETPPLSDAAIGYAVITAAYTRVLSEPDASSVSLGVVSEGTVLTVLERRLIRPQPGADARSSSVPAPPTAYWVLTGGDYRGWIPNDALVIYDSRPKAETAASIKH